jgi:hypothetical protein
MSNEKTTVTKDSKPADAKKPEKTIYDWTSEDKDCPDDIVVNASIIAADANADVRQDSPRIEPGDRRRGAYYVKLISHPLGTGLQLVKKVSVKRLAELEKTRQIRTGDRPADWVLEVRQRAAQGHQPGDAANVNTARANLAQAAVNW